MRNLAERVWFRICLALGRMLRAATYSTTRVVRQDGQLQLRKQRSFYARLLIGLGDPLLGILDTGVRVLSQRDWEERERLLHQTLRGTIVETDRDGALLLPWLAGAPLAVLLEDRATGDRARKKAIVLAVDALAALHRLGLTHGDAMAENVMVDLDAGAAHWFDFETVHDPARPMTWRRADDLRALLATTLLRTPVEAFSETLRQILDVYADDEVDRLLAMVFGTTLRRPLLFQLGQAPLSLRSYRQIGRSLNQRAGDSRRRYGAGSSA